MAPKELVFVPMDIGLAMEFAKLAARYRVRPGQKLREGMYVRIWISTSATGVGTDNFQVMGRPSMSGGSFDRLKFKKARSVEKRTHKFNYWDHGVGVNDIMHQQSFHLNTKTLALAKKLQETNIFIAWSLLRGVPYNKEKFDQFEWNADWSRTQDDWMHKNLMEQTEREEAQRWATLPSV